MLRYVTSHDCLCIFRVGLIVLTTTYYTYILLHSTRHSSVLLHCTQLAGNVYCWTWLYSLCACPTRFCWHLHLQATMLTMPASRVSLHSSGFACQWCSLRNCRNILMFLWVRCEAWCNLMMSNLYCHSCNVFNSSNLYEDNIEVYYSFHKWTSYIPCP